MATSGSGLWYLYFPLILLGITLWRYKKPKTGILLMLVLLFFSMFRGDGVGHDTLAYMDINGIAYNKLLYDEGLMGSNIVDAWGVRTEIASNFLNYLVYTYDLPPRIIIYVYSIITILFLFLALRRLKVNISFGVVFYVFLGLYFFSLSAARQMAAVSIFAFGLTFLFSDNKEKYFFFLFTILSSLFHASAIFFVWVFWLRGLKMTRQTQLIIMIFFVLITIIMSFNILDVVFSVFKIDYVSRYKGSFNESGRSLLGRMNDVVVYGFLLYMFYVRNNKIEGDLYDNIFVVAIALMALFGHSNTLILRVTYYLTVFLCIYISKVIIERNCLKQQSFVLLLVLFVLFKTYGNRIWADALTSGYYLMF